MSEQMAQFSAVFHHQQILPPNHLYGASTIFGSAGFPTATNAEGLNEKGAFLEQADGASAGESDPIKEDDGDASAEPIRVELKNRELWKKFHKFTNEMVIGFYVRWKG